MTGEDTKNLGALRRFLEDGTRVLSDAAERLTAGPLSPQSYQELADGCRALAIVLGTRAEHTRRVDQPGKDKVRVTTAEDSGRSGHSGQWE